MKVRKPALMAIVAGITIGATMVACYLLSDDTLEAYKRALRAQGERFMLAELRPDRTADASKRSTEWLEQAGRLDTAPKITPGLLELMHFTGPGTARVAWAQSRIQLGDLKTSEQF